MTPLQHFVEASLAVASTQRNPPSISAPVADFRGTRRTFTFVQGWAMHNASNYLEPPQGYYGPGLTARPRLDLHLGGAWCYL